jgi:hypothetical protein
MLAYFPQIHPDELLASTIARHHVHTRGVSHRATQMELYGTAHSRTAVAFPRNLAAIHSKTERFTGLTLAELVDRATLYPYFFAFASEKMRKDVFKKMVSKRSRQETAIVIGWAPVFDKLMFCPECVKADINRFGEAYWHRSHQLHSSHLCTIHAVPLLIAESRYFNDYSTPLEPLTKSVRGKAYLPALTEKCRQRLMEIAACGEAYLNGKTKSEEVQPLSDGGRKAFRAVYGLTRGAIDMTSLEQDIITYFGEQCLEILGLTIEPGDKNNWVRNQFRALPSPMPAKHIVLALFYEKCLVPVSALVKPDILERITGKRWACQNPAAHHFGEPVITDVYKVPQFASSGTLGFRCSCGYTFLAYAEGWNLRSEPKKIKVQEFGALFVSHVRELKAAGTSIVEIANRLGTVRNVVYSMLKDDYGSYQRPRPDLAIAGRKKGNQEATAAKRSGPTKKVDYAERDEQYSNMVKVAAGMVRLTVPPVRASKHHIVQMAGIGYSQLVRQGYFPKTLAALDELAETTASFHKRKLQEAQERD